MTQRWAPFLIAKVPCEVGKYKFWFLVHEYALWTVNSPTQHTYLRHLIRCPRWSRGITVLSKPSFLSIWLLNESITTKIACLGPIGTIIIIKKILQNNVGKCVSVLNHPVTQWHWQPNNAAKFRRYEASRCVVGFPLATGGWGHVASYVMLHVVSYGAQIVTDWNDFADFRTDR